MSILSIQLKMKVINIFRKDVIEETLIRGRGFSELKRNDEGFEKDVVGAKIMSSFFTSIDLKHIFAFMNRITSPDGPTIHTIIQHSHLLKNQSKGFGSRGITKNPCTLQFTSKKSRSTCQGETNLHKTFSGSITNICFQDSWMESGYIGPTGEVKPVRWLK